MAAFNGEWKDPDGVLWLSRRLVDPAQKKLYRDKPGFVDHGSGSQVPGRTGQFGGLPRRCD